jgi:hypothetical protein
VRELLGQGVPVLGEQVTRLDDQEPVAALDHVAHLVVVGREDVVAFHRSPPRW